MPKDRANRTRKNELKIYLSENEKYILDRKVELSKRKSASDYIRTLILFGFVYDVDYSYLRQYNETLGKISGNLNQIAKRINSTGNVYEEDMAEQALCFVHCGLADEKDQMVPCSEAEIEVFVTGGKLIAMGTADAESTTSYKSNIHKLYQGKALAVFEMFSPNMEISFSSKGYESMNLRPYEDK